MIIRISGVMAGLALAALIFFAGGCSRADWREIAGLPPRTVETPPPRPVPRPIARAHHRKPSRKRGGQRHLEMSEPEQQPEAEAAQAPEEQQQPASQKQPPQQQPAPEPTPAAAVETPAPAAAETPAPLQLVPAGTPTRDPDRADASHLIEQAQDTLSRLNRSSLSGREAADYDRVAAFIKDAREALKRDDSLAAKAYARKAALLASDLSDRTH